MAAGSSPQRSPSVLDSQAGSGENRHGELDPNGSAFTEDTSEPLTRGLHSREQEDLLNAIDNLRSENIDADINIPQIVVCGDQSSGKSSVLEAIAGLRFPVGIGAVTRFPTEIVLRRNARSHTSVNLRPVGRSTSAENDLVSAFKCDFDVTDPTALKRVIDAATQHLESLNQNTRIWNDVLRIELSGPQQDHLTLIDVPGLVHADVEAGKPGVKDTIKQLVKGYLSGPRTIVLAVVSANSDLALQKIIEYVKTDDSIKARTLGVITKPDRITSESGEVKPIVDFMQSESFRVGYGWHVVMNLPHTEEDRSPRHRDKREHDHLSNGEWARVARADVGIQKLRDKLKEHLFSCITEELPELMDQLQRKLNGCKLTLARLGPGRDTVEQQRQHLSNVLSKLHRLIEAALQGDYEKEEFSAFFDGDLNKGLRDFITNQSVTFAQNIRAQGKQYYLYHKSILSFGGFGELSPSEELTFFPPYTTVVSSITSRRVDLERYCEALTKYMKQTRGKNLPGALSPRTVTAIFRQQSAPWELIAREHLENCHEATRHFLKMATDHVAGCSMAKELLQKFIHPFLDVKGEELDKKATELLWPYQKCHPITYSAKYDANLWKRAYQISDAADTKSHDVGRRSWATIAKEQDFSEEEVVAAGALDQADAYYSVSQTHESGDDYYYLDPARQGLM